MLEKSTKDPATKEFTTRLQDWWIKLKAEEKGVPTDEVIEKVLSLISPEDKNVLSSPCFEAYRKLMEREFLMASGLNNRYDTRNVVFLEMLESPQRT
ncbi:hypothetical protein KXD40_008136 [Peronospora effusa]|nr:hypothetical protein KXD40_008136 [Peronospora effusa]